MIVHRVVALCGRLRRFSFLPAARARTSRQADGIVALTGGGARLDAAVALLESGAGKRLLITGVDLATTKAMCGAAHGGPAFDCCADLGFAAEDTHGNAEEAAAWARAHGYRSLIIVTASYHMPRSLARVPRRMPDMTLSPIRWSRSVDLDGWWHDARAAAAARRIRQISRQPGPDTR